MREKISQAVTTPFCILANRSLRDRGSAWPLIGILLFGGGAIAAFGIWDLIQSLPSYSMPVFFLLLGSALSLFGMQMLTKPRSHQRFWLGCDSEKLTLVSGESTASWPWPNIGPFRATETTDSGFDMRESGRDLNARVNFVQTTTVTLISDVPRGLPIEIPFNRFMPESGGELERAENFCRFLNDIRHRGQNGGLAAGESILVPADLHVVPMRDGAPASSK